MTIFNKKDADIDNLDDVEDTGTLSAPKADMEVSSAPRNKTKLLGGLLVAVIALFGGGYYYLNSMADVSPAPLPPVNAAANPAPANPVPGAPAAADALAPNAPLAGVPPQPDASAASMAAAPASPVPGAPATPDASVPNAPGTAVPGVPGTAVPGVLGAAIPPGPEGAAAPVPPQSAASMPKPDASDIAPPPTEEPSSVSASAAPKDTAPASAVPGAPIEPKKVDAAAAASTAAVAAAKPAEDLPVPAGATAAPVATAKIDKAPAATAGAAPSPAEMAIVQNAAVLDQLSQPAQKSASPQDPATMKSVNDILGKPKDNSALIRKLPDQYVIVKKDHDGGDIDSRLTAARTALSQNRNDAALQLFDDLHNSYPKDKRILMGRAVTLQRLGQNDQALAAYEDVLNADPKNLEALTNMLGLMKAQDPTLALSKLKELQATYPYNADIAAQLGISYGSAGDYPNALKYLDLSESLKPGNAEVIYNKAVLYDKTGHSDQAADLYRQIVQMNADGTLQQTFPIEQIERRLSTMH